MSQNLFLLSSIVTVLLHCCCHFCHNNFALLPASPPSSLFVAVTFFVFAIVLPSFLSLFRCDPCPAAIRCTRHISSTYPISLFCCPRLTLSTTYSIRRPFCLYVLPSSVHLLHR
ncbi:hypothetical protein EV361DRAFT_304707 [Lentinula raphanica]|nr:hypothetical protein EV361DRAFT_304707 [Lentinula raphanica]